MKLIIISGLSGSGKSIALNTLEDLDYYCIDNLPIGMLPSMVEQLIGDWGRNHKHVGVGIDARNSMQELERFPGLLKDFVNAGLSCETFFLEADNNTLLKRYSETRRKHPLTQNRSLEDAIRLERELLYPIAAHADLFIDTTHTNIYQLRDMVRKRVINEAHETMSLLFESFGYKHGVPSDADFVFDVRCLPNPHWEPGLRPFSGKDRQVIEYLEAEPWVVDMRQQILDFLEIWIPRFEKENRSYMTVAIGCTGGQHRSVYLIESIAAHFRKQRENIIIRHRELS